MRSRVRRFQGDDQDRGRPGEIRGQGAGEIPGSRCPIQGTSWSGRSTFVNERTVAVKADFAAMDIPRRIVETLKDGRHRRAFWRSR